MSDSNRRRSRTRTCFLSAVVCAIFIVTANAQLKQSVPDEWLGCGTDHIASNWYREGPNFTVRVFFRERPISGADVLLTGESSSPVNPGNYVIADRTTDSEGVAHFAAVPSGKYLAHLDEALMATSSEIEIEENGVSTKEARIDWPAEPFVTRSVRGWVSSWQRFSPQNRSEKLPLANVQIQLLSLRSGEVLLDTQTSKDGYYQFPVLADGLYVLRINQRRNQSTNAYDQAVEVASDASGEYMPRLLVDDSCGSGRVVEVQDGSDREMAAISRMRSSPHRY